MITESVAQLLVNTSESWGQQRQFKRIYLMPCKYALPCKCHCPLQTHSPIQAWQSCSQGPKWSVVLALCQRVSTVSPRPVLHSFFTDVWHSFGRAKILKFLSSQYLIQRCVQTLGPQVNWSPFSTNQSKSWFEDLGLFIVLISLCLLKMMSADYFEPSNGGC